MLESSLFPNCTDPDKKNAIFLMSLCDQVETEAPGRKEEIKQNLSLSKFFFFNSLNG